MKKISAFLMFYAVILISLQAQKVSNYTYHFDNGISVRSELGWNHVWVSQRFETLKDQSAPLSLDLRTLGDLSSSSTFKMLSGGREVKVQGSKPGTYTVRMTYKLSGKPGTLNFDVENVVIKPGSKTILSVTLYDYQIIVEETPGDYKGQSYFDSKVLRYRGSPEDNPGCGVPLFYMKGAHEKPVATGLPANSKSCRIKPATYDILLTLGFPGHVQKIWLENFLMKPDIGYKITTNLNAGVIAYAGTNREVKGLSFYPAGTADRQTGAPAPDRNLEILKCEGTTSSYACAPGSYDVLLVIGNGVRYEWRKNIVVRTGSRTEVK